MSMSNGENRWEQIKNNNFSYEEYVWLSRWNSYYYQIESVCKYSVGRGDILLIWVWDWIVGDILWKIGYNVTTFDFDKELNPDIVWDVTRIDEILNKKYDIVICCQVLEHIPFSEFESTIKKISRITNCFVLSLPNRCIWIKFLFYAPIIRNVLLKIRFRMFWKNNWNFKKDWKWFHYWEVDWTSKWKKKYIDNILKKYFNIDEYFVPFNNTYHMFWRLSKK